MADLSKIMRHVCPNICKECQPQCKKWQEMSNLKGQELMKFIKTQQEISGNDTDIDVISGAELSPRQRREETKMTSCCVTCDTILQQISKLLREIWDILEPQRNVCNVCRLAKEGKCNRQQIDKYSPRFDVPSTKEGFLSWLTKLRQILLKVLEGVTKSRCKIYKGEPKDELERLLQELRFPLQKQARDIRITSLTKLSLSSTERDESLVTSLIENTKLLERVLAKIKAEGRKIEMKIYDDHKYQMESKTSRFPELKVISAQPFPSSTSSYASVHKTFPPIPGKVNTDKNEIKSGSIHVKDDRRDQYKKDASRMMNQETKNLYEKKETVNKGRPDRIGARKKDTSPNIYRKLPPGDTKHAQKLRKSRSAIIQNKHQRFTSEKSKSSLSPTEKSTGKSVKHSVSFPGMMRQSKTKGSKEPTEKKHASTKTDAFIEELQKARAHASKQHLDTSGRAKRRTVSETSREENTQNKGKIKYDEDKTSPKRKLPVMDQKIKPRERSVGPKALREDKSKGKLKDEKDKQIPQIKSKRRIKGEEDIEVSQSKSRIEGQSSTQVQRDKEIDPRFKSKGKLNKKDEASLSPSGKVKIKEDSKSKPKLERISTDKGGHSEVKFDTSKNKLEKDFSKEKISLPTDKAKRTPSAATYTRRYTIQVSPQLILKKMNEDRVAELRLKKRLEKTKDKPFKKIKSLKSLPNLELLREKQKQRKGKQTPIKISESDISECDSIPEPIEMILGNKVVPLEPVSKPEYDDPDPEPLLFKVKAHFPEDDALLKYKAHSQSAITLASQKSWAEKGVIEYKLSNPKFIDLGYTQLPTVRVMRKSIVYKMEQPHPEEDWFRRHKPGSTLFYDTCEKLAEIDEDGYGRWYYKNGRMALNYCATEGTDTRNRYIVYSSGEDDGTSYPRCDTILASFDHLGNGIVYDHCGNVRLKYNQTEGEIFDKSICPLGRWKWHSLNTTLSALQNVYVEQRVKIPHTSELDILFDNVADASKASELFDETVDEITEGHKNMHAIELRNFFKEKKQMLLQKYQPFQLKMKVLKLNDQFSMRIYEQRKIYLYFNTGARTLKLNLGLILIPNEVLGTETVNLDGIMTPFDRHIPQSDSVANILDIINDTRKRMRKKNCFHKFYSGIRNTSSPLGVIR